MAFETKELRRLCESQTYAEEQLGVGKARFLRARLADIRAVCCVVELADLGISVRQANPDDHLSLEIDGEVRLLLCANHNQTPMQPDGKTDWQKISRVRLLAIEVEND